MLFSFCLNVFSTKHGEGLFRITCTGLQTEVTRERKLLRACAMNLGESCESSQKEVTQTLTNFAQRNMRRAGSNSHREVAQRLAKNLPRELARKELVQSPRGTYAELVQ